MSMDYKETIDSLSHRQYKHIDRKFKIKVIMIKGSKIAYTKPIYKNQLHCF